MCMSPALWFADRRIFSEVATRPVPRETRLYLDCGAQDRYGLARGHRTLRRILEERGVSHTLELPPGDHGYDFVRARLAASLPFLAARLDEKE